MSDKIKVPFPVEKEIDAFYVQHLAGLDRIERAYGATASDRYSFECAYKAGFKEALKRATEKIRDF